VFGHHPSFFKKNDLVKGRQEKKEASNTFALPLC
jgi:hypothetical protein